MRAKIASSFLGALYASLFLPTSFFGSLHALLVLVGSNFRAHARFVRFAFPKEKQKGLVEVYY